MQARIWTMFPLLGIGLSTQAQFHVSTGDRVFVASANELYLQENLSNNGTVDHLTMNGATAQSITGTGTIGSLVVNKTVGSAAEKTVTIASGRQALTGVLTLTSGTLAAGGLLTLKSTASGTARVAEHASTGTITGNVVVERYIDVNGRPKQWRTLGLPFSGAMTLSGVNGFAIDYTAGRRSVMYYNEGTDDGIYGSGSTGRNAGYVSLETSTQTIPAGQGLMAWLYAPQGSTDPANGTGNMSGDLTLSATGELRESGNAVNMPVTFSGRSFAGWNLLSNPFASSIDWSHNSITKTNINDAIYRWNPASTSWTVWTAAGTGTTAGLNSIIEPGGAFFVKATGGSPVLTIPQSAKTASSSTLVHFGRVPQLDVRGERMQTPLRLAGVRLSVKGQGNPHPDEIYVDVSKPDATEGFDRVYDAVSMGRTSGAGLAVKDARGDVYAMQFDRPIAEAGVEKRYYPLRVTSPAVGETTLELWTAGAWNPLNSVSLIDTKTGRTMLLRDGRLSYPFRMDSLRAEGRFLLAVNHVKVDRETGLPAAEMKLLGNPVQGEVLDLLLTHPTAQPRQWSVVDMTGRTVATGRFSENASDVQHRLPVPGLRTTGSYVLQVELDNGERRQLRFLKP